MWPHNFKMEKAFFYILLLGLALPGMLLAQAPAERRCATNEVYENLIKQHPEYALRRQVLEEQAKRYLESRQNLRTNSVADTITVVFHVVYSSGQQNIPDAQLLSQLQILNDDFNRLNADTVNTPAVFNSVAGNPRIYFCLASLDPDGNPTTGITRTFTNQASFSFTENRVKFNNQGGHDVWNPELYLNIWVCNLADNVLGYAQFPGGPKDSDGIVLRYSSVGKFPFNNFPGPYNQGRTATHELGHWLGLHHIWGENDNECTDTDFINDTPNQADKSSGCPKFPQVSCNNGPNGDMFMNFMDYTNDNCMNLFTKDQSAKMNAILHTTRAQMLASNMCTNKMNADFRAVPDAIFPGQTTDFFYFSNGRRPTSFQWQFEGGDPSVSTERNPQNIRYDREGSYTVTLTVSDATGSDTEVKKGYLNVTSRDLKVSPNPAIQEFTVAAPAGTIMEQVWVYSTTGQLIMEATLNARTLELSAQKLHNGLYLVKAKTSNGQFLGQRLIIQK